MPQELRVNGFSPRFQEQTKLNLVPEIIKKTQKKEIKITEKMKISDSSTKVDEKYGSKKLKEISLPVLTLIEPSDDRNYIVDAQDCTEAINALQPRLTENEGTEEEHSDIPEMVCCRNFVPEPVKKEQNKNRNLFLIKDIKKLTKAQIGRYKNAEKLDNQELRISENNPEFINENINEEIASDVSLSVLDSNIKDHENRHDEHSKFFLKKAVKKREYSDFFEQLNNSENSNIDQNGRSHNEPEFIRQFDDMVEDALSNLSKQKFDSESVDSSES